MEIVALNHLSEKMAGDIDTDLLGYALLHIFSDADGRVQIVYRYMSNVNVVPAWTDLNYDFQIKKKKNILPNWKISNYTENRRVFHLYFYSF